MNLKKAKRIRRWIDNWNEKVYEESSRPTEKAHQKNYIMNRDGNSYLLPMKVATYKLGHCGRFYYHLAKKNAA